MNNGGNIQFVDDGYGGNRSLEQEHVDAHAHAPTSEMKEYFSPEETNAMHEQKPKDLDETLFQPGMVEAERGSFVTENVQAQEAGEYPKAELYYFPPQPQQNNDEVIAQSEPGDKKAQNNQGSPVEQALRATRDLTASESAMKYYDTITGLRDSNMGKAA